MAREVLFDTSGFFALIDTNEAQHQNATAWLESERGRLRPVTTEWIVAETCTLLVARRRPHMVARFLDYLDRTGALLLINPDDSLLRAAKAFIRRRADHGYSFVDCLSFCLMRERGIQHAFTTDQHFRKAGYTPILA